MSTIPRLVISAPSSGHGKTAVSVGLLAALTARGYRAAGFKIGPDHVDAAYLGLAAGRPGRNLDPRMVGAKRMGPLFAHGAGSLDIAVVEGTMGLFDGLAGRTDSESTAQISGLLRAPVILVVDVGAMGQSVAALVHGFRAYDELLWLGGVILNRVASARHEQLLREALDDIGVPVLGALRRHALTDVGDAGTPLPSRNHGVAPVVHHNIDAVRAVRRLGEVIAGAVDIDRTMALARSAPRLTADPWNAEAEIAAAGAADAAIASIAATRIGRRPVVGVAFAYPETAELLRAAGADVVPFDPLRDETLPDGVDGLVIGAALPESYAEELTFNSRLRAAVANHAAAGKPIAAEGTGLVWLCRDFNGRPMCGVVDASARETDLVVLGYREATARSSSVLLPIGTQVVGHKMHRTSIAPRAGLQAAWTWAGGPAEGFVQRGVHASYLGLHWAGTPGIATRFVTAASATAAPTPGQWTTPSANPYGRPASAVPTAQVPMTRIVAVAPTLQLPAGPPVSAPPVPVAAPGLAASSAAAASGPSVADPAPSSAAAVADPSAIANAPTSPGASSPFGPAVGAAMPTPWTAASPAAGPPVSSASAPWVPAVGRPDSSAPVSSASAPWVPAAAQPDSSAPVSSASGPWTPGQPASPMAAPLAPTVGQPDSSAPVSSAAVHWTPATGQPVSSAAGPWASASSAPVSSVSGPWAPASSAPVSSAAGQWTPASSAPSAPTLSEPAVAVPAGWGGSPGPFASVSGAATGLPGDSEEPTSVLPAAGSSGAPLTAAGDGATVGVRSSANGPAPGAGLPSSGVVPTTVPLPTKAPAPPPVSVSPSDAPSSSPVVTAASPVSSPPGIPEPLTAPAPTATSAAVPVSSAPLPQVTAPVSAAPAGVTAMPAAGSDLVAPADEPYPPAPTQPADRSAEPDLAEQAPVSAPPGIAAAPAPQTSASPVSGLPSDAASPETPVAVGSTSPAPSATGAPSAASVPSEVSEPGASSASGAAGEVRRAGEQPGETPPVTAEPPAGGSSEAV